MTDVDIPDDGQPKRIQIVVTMDDDARYDVFADNRDMLRWEFTRKINGWPDAQEAPMHWATFLAWSTLNRNGRLNGMPQPEFFERAVDVSIVQAKSLNPTVAGRGNA